MMAPLLRPPNFMNDEDRAKVVVDWLASSLLLMLGLLFICILMDVPWIFIFGDTRSFLAWFLRFASMLIISVLNTAYFFLIVAAIDFHQFGVILIAILGRLLTIYLVRCHFSKKKARIKPIEPAFFDFPSFCNVIIDFCWHFNYELFIARPFVLYELVFIDIK